MAIEKKDLVRDMKPDDLKWIPVTLRDGVLIKVCSPVVVNGYYVPVSTEDTFKISRDHGVYPLTRAVADQVHNQAAYFPFKNQGDDPFNIEKYNDYLQPLYGPSQGNKLVSGAHKLWLLSAAGKTAKNSAVNYGFYIDRSKLGKPETRANGGGGAYMKNPAYSVVQPLGISHNATYWDYSQLLQLMRMDQPVNVNGKLFSLGMCILAGLPAVWDEPQTLSATDLPW